MKTTLDIPESIMASALSVSPVKTKRAVVIRALEEFVRRSEMAALAEELGHSPTFMAPDDLRALRQKEKDSLLQ
jgi:Arc/MetJ family transcription regulator